MPRHHRSRRNPLSSTIENVDQILNRQSPTISDAFEGFAEFQSLFRMHADESAIGFREFLSIRLNRGRFENLGDIFVSCDSFQSQFRLPGGLSGLC